MITPGPVVITVGFIGYLVAGLPGALAAAGGVFLPVYLVVVLLSPAYRRYSANLHVKNFVAGVTAAATGALAGAVVVLAMRSIHDVTTACIAVSAVIALKFWKLPEPVIIGASALTGLIVHASVHF
jgi:chromate transporter